MKEKGYNKMKKKRRRQAERKVDRILCKWTLLWWDTGRRNLNQKEGKDAEKSKNSFNKEENIYKYESEGCDINKKFKGGIHEEGKCECMPYSPDVCRCMRKE